MAGNKWKARRPDNKWDDRRAEVEELLARMNKSAAAQTLGISPARLNFILQRYREDDARATDAKDLAERLRKAAEILDPTEI